MESRSMIGGSTSKGIKIAAAAFGALLILGSIVGLIEGEVLRQWILGLIEPGITWGYLGLAVFIGVQIGVTIFGVVPASLIGMAAGAFYGTSLGFTVSAIATLFGAMVAFALARTVLRGRVLQWAEGHRHAERIHRLLSIQGWRIVVIVRISPVMPFAPTSWALGLSRLTWRDYMIGTTAALPSLFGYVLLGDVTKLLATSDQAWTKTGMFLSAFILSAGLAWFYRDALLDPSRKPGS